MVSNQEKQTISDALREKIKSLGISQADSAKRIGVSAATITNILGGKWDNIEGAWMKVKSFVEERVSGWQVAETANFKMLQDLCADAQSKGITRAVSFRPGSGKTFAAKYYADNNRNVFYVAAVGDMSKRQLLSAICLSMGIGAAYRLSDMLDDIISKLETTIKPLIIIDEFDELDNKALRVFKDLYNTCACGFVLIGGQHLRERINRGVRNCKQSYAEIFSRIGGEFVALKEITDAAVERICNANGVTDKTLVKDIATQAKGDLRRVKALVESVLLTSKN